jgi:DNA-binding FadR family transcriptional regulator
MAGEGSDGGKPSQRLYLQIAQEIADKIDAGQPPAGERLAPERELAVTLGVSRTVLREALLALEMRNFVEIRIGAGVYVLPPERRAQTPQGLASVLDAPLFDVVRARRMAEGEAAFLAAQRIGAEDLKRLETVLATMEAAVQNVVPYDQADAEFHAIIAQACGNQVIQAFIQQLWEYRRGGMWSIWYDKTRSVANRRRTVEAHRRIFQALQRGQPDVARTAMQAHLDVLGDRFLEPNL